MRATKEQFKKSVVYYLRMYEGLLDVPDHILQKMYVLYEKHFTVSRISLKQLKLLYNEAITN